MLGIQVIFYGAGRDYLEGLEGCWLWRISGSISGDDGFGFMELVFFKRIGEARIKLMGIEENDNGQGNGSMVN